MEEITAGGVQSEREEKVANEGRLFLPFRVSSAFS